MARRVLTSLLVVVCCSAACTRRERLNASCQWTHHPAVALDLRTTHDRRHLNEDVRVAEELGIRYGDSFTGRDWPGRRQQEQCTATLFTEIAKAHHVALDDVVRARGRRDWRADLAFLILPITVVIGFAADRLASRVCGLFLPENGWVEKRGQQ